MQAALPFVDLFAPAQISRVSPRSSPIWRGSDTRACSNRRRAASQRRSLRAGDRRAHRLGHRRQGRRQGADRAGRVVEAGWIGGGCARAAVVKAAHKAWPTAVRGWSRSRRKTGSTNSASRRARQRDGVIFAKNACPSQGTMDIFVEPVLPRPRLLILGASPVAVALASQAPTFGFAVAVAAPPGDLNRFLEGSARLEGVAPPPRWAKAPLSSSRRRARATAPR